MFRSIIVFSSFLFLISCRQPNQEKSMSKNEEQSALDSVAVVSDPQSNLNVQTNDFSEIDSSGILVFPLAMAQNDRKGNGLIYKSAPPNSFWNMVFLNGRTNEHHLLSEKRMIIRSYDLNYSGDPRGQTWSGDRHLFYEIIMDDLNRDGDLGVEDPTYLFLSNKQGKELKQISPSGFDLNNWKFVRSLHKIFMTVRKDSDQNGRFDQNDELSTFSFDLELQGEAVDVFPTTFRNKMKVLYDQDWKAMKK